MRNSALIIAISILLSRVLGILREMMLARMAGINLEKNALDLAFMIPDILNSLIATGFLSIIFIPIFTGYMVKKDEERAWKFFSHVLNSLGLLMLVLLVPAWIYMRECILLFSTVNPSPEVLDKAVHFGRIILPGQIAFFAGSFFVALQHTRKQFLIPALTGLVYNVAIIVGGWLGRAQGIDGFAWGVPVGAFSGFLILQWWGARRGGLQWKSSISFRDPDLHRYVKLMLPLMFGVGSMFALEFIIKSTGSAFGDHGISALNYSYRLMYTLVAVFGFSVGVTSYPDMARLAKEGRIGDLNSRVANSLDRMFTFLVPAVATVWLLAFPAVRIVLERGAFDRSATELVAMLLRWYLPASLGLCAQAVLVRSFYAQERMWTPTLVNTGLFLASLLFYTPAAHLWGIRSVPIVGALTALIQVSTLLWIWQHRNGTEGMRKHAKNLLRSLLVLAGAGGALAWLGRFWEPWMRSAKLTDLLLVSAGVAVGVFALVLVLQVAIGSTSAREIAWERLQKLLKKIPGAPTPRKS